MDQDVLKQRQLQKQLLQHLQMHGPSEYNHVYMTFDQEETGEIGAVLQELKELKYVELISEGRVAITPSGSRLLDNAEYWGL